MPNSKPLSLFWKKALLGAGVVLAVAGWAELRLRRMPTLYHLKRDGLSAAAPGMQILVLGASQANQGLDPGVWPVPGYNAACVGQDAYYDEALFEAWLPRLPRLRHLVLAISMVSLDSTLMETAETWRSFAYSQSFGLANESPALAGDLRNWSALALSEPWPALQLAAHGFVDANAVTLTAQGFQAMPGIPEDELDLRLNELTAGKRWRYHEGNFKAADLGPNTARYQKMLALAAASKVQVSLVIFPVDASYAAAVPAPAVARRLRLLKALAKEGPARVFDYFKDPRFNSKDFADVDHLNQDGARKFSQILWKEALHD